MRARRGVSLKKLAPDLGVSYTYLSKLEGHQARPSEDLIDRVADYFGYDADVLYLSADRIPPDLSRLLRDRPDEALALLKTLLRPPDG
jgi:HTH-type transcriptional regulator, competence development regulator